MRRRAMLAAPFLGLAATVGEADLLLANAVDLLLVLAVDVSESMNVEGAWLQRAGYRDAVTDPRVLAAMLAGLCGAIGVAYVEWAGTGFQRLLIPWTRIADHRGAEAWAEGLAVSAASHAAAVPTYGYYPATSISSAIGFSRAVLAAAPWPAGRRVIDISGDGVNNDGPPVEEARDRAVAEGITINALAIEGDEAVRRALGAGARLADYFRVSVVGGPGAFAIEADGFGAFAEAIRHKLAREIAWPAAAHAPA